MLHGSSSRKRSFEEDDDSAKQPSEKRVRFPKGKKVKQGVPVFESVGEEVPAKDPRLAARDRAVRRKNVPGGLLDYEAKDQEPEIQYEDNETFVEEGVQVEPFNLDKEREDGYFDESGNYIEYVNESEIKDAWLDSVDSHPKYAGKKLPAIVDDKPRDLTTEELATINRRIANNLQPGEKVLQALKRLKGSTDKKHKMSAETKEQFDQLTEDAMKLMDNGDYGVYDEKQEHFAREAVVYEKLPQARRNALLGSTSQGNSDDAFDMFGDDDGTVVEDHHLNGGASSVQAANGDGSSSVHPSNVGGLQSDYVYDDSTGYYYSSGSGYYYDPSSGL